MNTGRLRSGGALICVAVALGVIGLLLSATDLGGMLMLLAPVALLAGLWHIGSGLMGVTNRSERRE